MAASTVTVLDGLRKEFANIAQLKLSPDAQQHGKFIDGLMTAIQQYVSQAAQATIGGGAGQPGTPQPGQAPQSPLGGGGAAALMGPPGAAAPNQIAPGGGPGMAGLAPSPGNMDEIRRMLTGSVNV